METTTCLWELGPSQGPGGRGKWFSMGRILRFSDSSSLTQPLPGWISGCTKNRVHVFFLCGRIAINAPSSSLLMQKQEAPVVCRVELPTIGSSASAFRNAKRIFGAALVENPKTAAAAFACTVTVPSSNAMDWVARNGAESIFETLRLVLPEVSKS
jgi:hypothetical protein